MRGENVLLVRRRPNLYDGVAMDMAARLMESIGSLTWLEAAIQALEDGKELTALQIIDRIRARRLRPISGKTPEATVASKLYTAIIDGDPRVCLTVPGRFTYTGASFDGFPVPKVKDINSGNKPEGAVSFLDAAEQILQSGENRRPMQLKDIVRRALDDGLISTRGLTPMATLSAQIGTDRRRRAARGDVQRFTNPSRGFYGLAIWDDKGIARHLVDHRNEITSKLKERLHLLSSSEFEILVARILVSLGVEDAEVVGRSGDNGIDVRGTLVVAKALRRSIVVQAKRWNRNSVGSPEVRNLRGSLSPHDLALLVTVGVFSPSAKEEAARSDATPVGLLAGDDIIDLMLEHQIGVVSAEFQVFKMADFDFEIADVGWA